MYSFSISRQAWIFICCVGLGFLSGIVYGALRMLRKLISESMAAVIIQDVVFFVLNAVFVFCFLLISDYGKIRAYSMCALPLGFCAYYFGIGSLAMRILDKCTAIIRKGENFLLFPIRTIYKKMYTFSKKKFSMLKNKSK